MPTPRLSFTAFSNSFKVTVENLEELSVDQIQELESFVSKRRGVFDFNTYSFSIQKRVGFGEFEELLKSLQISARCRELLIPSKVEQRISFGQYKGMPYSEIPSSYLLWLKTNHKGKDKIYIDAECKKRSI